MTSGFYSFNAVMACLFALAWLQPAGAAAQDSLPSKKWVLQGYLESYYLYDFNRPASNERPPFVYSHNRHNEFNVNLAFFKAAYQSGRTRANLALAAGSYMQANYTSEPSVLRHLFEANVGYQLSKQQNLWFDIGVMPSHIGFESAISKDCWTVTRSIMADNTPYFESGAKLTYKTKNDRWLFSLLALNGWQRITRAPGSSLMSWGTQVQYRAGDNVLLNYSTFLGGNDPDSLRRWRMLHNFYGIMQINPRMAITLGLDLGQQQSTRGSSSYHRWLSSVAIARFTPVKQWAFALRGEYYRDKNGVMMEANTPNGFGVAGASFNADFLPEANMALRLEMKWWNSRDPFFDRAGRVVRANTALTFSAAVSF